MSASERIRLKDFRLHTDGARCEAQVSLGWDEEDTYVGTSRGPSSRAGSCRCAAEATITALESAAENRVSLELVGLKTVKAFDSTIVIACLVSRSEHHVLPFLGACLARDGHVSRYAALAVLDATNRLLGGFDE
ncbi:MAG: hypothetical protein IH876_16820 [Gemmatimonadetes bacterium]|nr:hypothetical protein [Gemmatimonadota bacterium]